MRSVLILVVLVAGCAEPPSVEIVPEPVAPVVVVSREPTYDEAAETVRLAGVSGWTRNENLRRARRVAAPVVPRRRALPSNLAIAAMRRRAALARLAPSPGRGATPPNHGPPPAPSPPSAPRRDVGPMLQLLVLRAP